MLTKNQINHQLSVDVIRNAEISVSNGKFNLLVNIFNLVDEEENKKELMDLLISFLKKR